MRLAGVGLRDGEGPGAPPKPCQPPALMRGNETDALLGQNLLFWCQREAWCQIANAVVWQRSWESSRLPSSEPIGPDSDKGEDVANTQLTVPLTFFCVGRKFAFQVGLQPSLRGGTGTAAFDTNAHNARKKERTFAANNKEQMNNKTNVLCGAKQRKRYRHKQRERAVHHDTNEAVYQTDKQVTSL